MTPERYAQVEAIFHAALELPPERRGSYLARVCGSDEELRREVDSLLIAHHDAGSFAEGGPNLAAAWLDRQTAFEAPGEVIGSYALLSLLGRGGMGEVYLAEDRRLGRQVAVKVLRPEHSANPVVLRRFEQEARAASSLNHPNIVTIHDVGRHGDRQYIAMEYVAGDSLALRIGQRQDPTTVAKLGVQLAQALAVAHAAGIVHRDIKPENVVVRDDGYLKVLDFGLARLAAEASLTGTAVTQTSVIMGTPRYMAPEQARGDTVTSATDVFAMGLVLYELLTAAHPFEAPSVLAMLHAITTGAAPPARRHVPELPARLDQLLQRMLQREPASRPRAAEVEAELAAIAAGATESTSTATLVRITLDTEPTREPSLPVPMTSLVGRENEVATIVALLRDAGTRLLTLTGPGGTGKTRLAIEAARALVPHYNGGVAFVNLAPVTDPRLIVSAVAHVLGVRESADRSLLDAIADHLRSCVRTLLVLDNFEQVTAGAPVVKAMLDACPTLQILTTSRVAIRVYGEQELAVPALPLPAAGALFSPSTLVNSPSVALFVERAAAVRPGFSVTPRNAAAIVEIVRKLDGLPLAIELAAARIKVLSPADLLARIARPLDLLTGGPRDLPARQQTLRQTIKWSYDLLSEDERRLFRRLSAFVGGATLEAIEAVCDVCQDLGLPVLDGVSALVDNSLAIQHSPEDGDARFSMLEMFREYGREQLAEHGEAASVDRAHAAYMLVLAEEDQAPRSAEERDAWLRRCDLAHANFRKAIDTLVESGDAEWALRLSIALFRFWEQRDHITEARTAFDRVLRLPMDTSLRRLRAGALYCATVMASIQGDLEASRTLADEACALYRELGDTRGLATSLTAMAFHHQRRGDFDAALAAFAESVSLWVTLGDPRAIDLARANMANCAKSGGQFELAERLFDEVIRSSVAREDHRCVAFALNGLGDLEALRGNREEAARYHERSLEQYRALNDSAGQARVLVDLGEMAMADEDFALAERRLHDAIAAFVTMRHEREMVHHLESLAVCVARQGREAAAVALVSAATAIRQRTGVPAKPDERTRRDRVLGDARRHLGQEAYERAWADGLLTPVTALTSLTAAQLSR